MGIYGHVMGIYGHVMAIKGNSGYGMMDMRKTAMVMTGLTQVAVITNA